jgi:methanogenic corrinoid protein MtbC1
MADAPRNLATLDQLYQAIVDLKEDLALELAQKAVAQGEATASLMLGTCQRALRMVGERYERGRYFLTALVLAGEIFTEVLALVPALRQPAPSGSHSGRVVLGTVRADIHDIGKNVFRMALQTCGFEVIDLGVDVPEKRFLEEIECSRPDVVCLSGLILAGFDSMRSTTRHIRAHERELGYHPPIVIGGGTVDGEICAYVGADSWSTDAMEGVRICEELLAT